MILQGVERLDRGQPPGCDNSTRRSPRRISPEPSTQCRALAGPAVLRRLTRHENTNFPANFDAEGYRVLPLREEPPAVYKGGTPPLFGSSNPTTSATHMLRSMLLSPECARVLGALIEKGLATPQQYPLTINALQAACNQTSNREPVVAYDETVVLAALDELKDRKLVRFVLPSHGRSVVRYRQVLDETLALDARQCAVLAVLLSADPDHRRAAHPDRAHGEVREPRRDRP